MTVRAKLLILSTALLVLFAAVLASSMVMHQHNSQRVAAIVEFHLPLSAAISDLDVATSDYELQIERMLRETHQAAAEEEADRQQVERTKTRIIAGFDRAN